MMHVGDIMSTVGVFSTVGGNLLLFEYPTVLNTSTVLNTVLMISPMCIMIFRHSTEHLPEHSTHDIPNVHHDIPPQY